MRRLVACAVVVLGLAGCGGSAGDGNADPAKAVPPSSVYFEMVVKPEGDQRERMEALAGKLLRTEDPGGKIVELFESLDEGPDGAFERDVKTWLGRRVGIAVRGLDRDEPDVVIAIATTDAGEAQDALERDAKAAGEKKRTHRDVDYWVDKDGWGSGVVGDFAIIASSEKAMHGAITVEEDRSLASAKRFEQAVERLPEEREGTIYFDLKSVVDEMAGVSGVERQIVNLFLGGAPASAIAVLAEEDQLALESRGPADQPRSLATMFTGLGYLGATSLVEELPGDAIVAVGAPDLGQTAKQLADVLAGPLGGAVVAGQLEEQFGIDLDRDVYGWIGDVALFVRGESVSSLGGGLVIGVRDRATARRAVPKLIGALQLQAGIVARPVALGEADLAFEVTGGGIPLPVFVALAGDRAVVAVGRDSALDALSPRARLRDSDVWDRADGVLDGVDPAMVVDLPAALALIEQGLADDPDFALVKPYLDTLSVLAAGSGKDGDERRSRLALGVK